MGNGDWWHVKSLDAKGKLRGQILQATPHTKDVVLRYRQYSGYRGQLVKGQGACKVSILGRLICIPNTCLCSAFVASDQHTSGSIGVDNPWGRGPSCVQGLQTGKYTTPPIDNVMCTRRGTGMGKSKAQCLAVRAEKPPPTRQQGWPGMWYCDDDATPLVMKAKCHWQYADS